MVFINGNDLVRSVKAGCIKLEHNREKVDLLNVFPVPDGDTGTNMYLTLLSAVKEGEKNLEKPLGKVAKAISMGSLMGARGNSGVILSQIFRGMAKVLEAKEQATAQDMAMALKAGSDTAYEAVMKPVEGTILTVAREIARMCEAEAKQNDDILAVLLRGVQAGQIILQKTPNMLPILKEAGVVDAGGQGFLLFLEGMVENLAGESEIVLESYREKISAARDSVGYEPVQLEFQYCTEVLLKGENLHVQDMRDHLAPLGDSMLVVGGNDIVKIHIHSNHPGKVLEWCQQWGSLNDIKINNMLEEAHQHINNWEEMQSGQTETEKEVGVVAVAAGEGIIRVFKSLGVEQIVSGGQTMNPSTEELLNACGQVKASSVIILPNNSNIIMAARQAAGLCRKKAEVIPTRSVMQAISALIAYNPHGDAGEVVAAMAAEMKIVKYAEVTYAVRNSSVNGFNIKEGDFIGLIEDEIVDTGSEPAAIVKSMLGKMVGGNSELITIFYGDDTGLEEIEALKDWLGEVYPECETEIHYGGQPNYNYLLSVE